MNKQFTFHETYWVVLKEMGQIESAKAINILCEYAFNNKEPETTSGLTKVLLEMAKLQMNKDVKPIVQSEENSLTKNE